MPLSKKDIDLIMSARKTCDSEIGYDDMRSCLVWSDEMIFGLSPAAHELITDFRIARNFLYHWPMTGLKSYNFLSTTENSEAIIEEVREAVPDWIGLKRFELTPEELKFFIEKIEEDRTTLLI